MVAMAPRLGDRWEALQIVRKRHRNKEAWIKEPDHEEDKEVAPSTTFLHFNVAIVEEFFNFFGVGHLPKIQKVQKEARLSRARDVVLMADLQFGQ